MSNGGEWTVVERKKRKSKTGTILVSSPVPKPKLKPNPKAPTEPNLESLRSRFEELNRSLEHIKLNLGEGPALDIHTTVSQLLYVNKDAEMAGDLFDQLDTLVEKRKGERQTERRGNLGKGHPLDEVDYILALRTNRSLPSDLRQPLEELVVSKQKFDESLDDPDYPAGAKAHCKEMESKLENIKGVAQGFCVQWNKTNGAKLGEVVKLAGLPKEQKKLHGELVKASEAFEESLKKSNSVLAAADCKDLDGLLRVFLERKEFTELDDPIGEGIWKINAVRIYKPPRAMEVPGTGFDEVCPGQDHVNRQIVEAKISGKPGLRGTPLVPAVITPDGKIVLQDKHHTFVACMALGRPVKLALTSNPLTKAKSSWMGCTWKGFEKPGKAGAGFSVPKDQASELEGDPELALNWEDVVPWRKDIPDSDDGKVVKMVEDFKSLDGREEDVNEQLKLACKDDKGLADKLYEVLKIGAITVTVRKTPEKSTGGDWDAAENTIYLDDNLKPVDMVDMLVWEAHNAIHQIDFSKLQHEAYAERMEPSEVGDKKAKIEAKTEIEYLEHLLARAGKGSEISQNGRKHLEGIDQKFVEKNLKPFSKMDPKEREQHQGVVEAIFIETPHDANKKLPDRAALKSGELYAYEHVSDTQNVKGIIAYFRDKIPEDHPKRKAFMLALGQVTDSPAQTSPDKPPLSWAGKFYDLVSRSANTIFGLKLSEFSGSQTAVAEYEYSQLKQSWAGPLALKLEEVANMVVEEEELPPEVPVEPLTRWKKVYDEHFKRLEQALLKLPTVSKVDAWALRHGIESRPVIGIISVIETASEEAGNAVRVGSTTDVGDADSRYEPAAKILEKAVEKLALFEKQIHEVKAGSDQEVQYRKNQDRLEQSSVFLVRNDTDALRQWAKENSVEFKDVNNIRRAVEDALIKSFKFLSEGEMVDGKPVESSYEKCNKLLVEAIKKLEIFESKMGSK